LTSTFYGNWLPGDPRGFVSRVRDRRPDDPDEPRGADATPLAPRREHDTPGTPYDADLPGLHGSARSRLRCTPIRVTLEQAHVLVAQFQETAAYRTWRLLATAVMYNHVHIVVGLTGDPD